MSKQDKIIVTFLKPWRGYAVGEVAGFDEEAATALIDSDRAEIYKKPKGGKVTVQKNASGIDSLIKKDADEGTDPDPDAGNGGDAGGDSGTGLDTDEKP